MLKWNRLIDLFESKDVYKTTRRELNFFLLLPFVEIVHALFKLIPSNPMIVSIQVIIRYLVIRGIVDKFELVNFFLFIYKSFLIYFQAEKKFTSKIIYFKNFENVKRQSSKSMAVVLLHLAWSISEIIRYFYYVFNLLTNNPPKFLTWCR